MLEWFFITVYFKRWGGGVREAGARESRGPERYGRRERKGGKREFKDGGMRE